MERGRGRGGDSSGGAKKGYKMHQVHEQAQAKIRETERLRQALKISKDYEEGGHWRRQEERLKKALEREAEEKDDKARPSEDDDDD